MRGVDLNHRPPGYEPDELPDCSTPRRHANNLPQQCQGNGKYGIMLSSWTSFFALFLWERRHLQCLHCKHSWMPIPKQWDGSSASSPNPTALKAAGMNSQLRRSRCWLSKQGLASFNR